MPVRMILAMLLALALLATGCMTGAEQQSLTNAPTKETELIERIERLEKSLASEIERSFKNLKDILEIRFPKPVRLNVSDLKSYQRITSSNDGTPFFLSLRDVVPFLNGYKLKLEVGNPSSVQYQGFTAYLHWGSSEARHSQQYSLTEVLRPGRWTPVEIVLTPASKTDLEHLEFSMETAVIVLQGGSR